MYGADACNWTDLTGLNSTESCYWQFLTKSRNWEYYLAMAKPTQFFSMKKERAAEKKVIVSLLRILSDRSQYTCSRDLTGEVLQQLCTNKGYSGTRVSYVC